MQFETKRALIVGGSGGIGKSLSELLCASGASVVVHGRRNSSQFSAFRKNLQQKALDTGVFPIPEVKILVQNITSEGFTELKDSLLIKEARNTDILIVSLGPFLQKSLSETDYSDWERMALLNYALPGLLVSTALPYMISNKWGRILLFGGTRTQNVNGFLTNAAYAGAKTGVCSLVRSVALAYAPYGITCNALLPGMTDTEYVSQQTRASLAKKMPSKKLISTMTVAESGMFLLEQAELNGVLLNVDSGWDPRQRTITTVSDLTL